MHYSMKDIKEKFFMLTTMEDYSDGTFDIQRIHMTTDPDFRDKVKPNHYLYELDDIEVIGTNKGIISLKFKLI